MQKIIKIGGWSFKMTLGLVCCLFAYISLFVIGSASLIIPYVDWGPLPTIKLGLLLFGVLAAITLSYYYLITSLINALHKEEFVRFFLIIGICISSGVVALYSAPPGIYIGMGDYLRDTHGINWYFMDSGGWSITEVIVMTPIIAALLNLFVSKKLLRTKN